VFETLPATAAEFSAWTWPQIAPYYEDLLARPLSSATVDEWLADWTRLGSLHDEVNTRFTVATTINTADEETSQRYRLFLDEIVPEVKAGGGYSVAFSVAGRPFIFTNSVGVHEDVQTLLHEGGHSFHTFEMARLPYLQQRQEQMLPMEFAEVASMGMELLAAPYLTEASGGFYSEAEAARARIDVLEGILTLWPYMAMIDGLQHWIYERHQEASDLDRCDDYWVELSSRFRPQMDWSGLDVERRTFWHSQSHVFQDPFYYIEYGMAQLGAVQIWANALHDQADAVTSYRKALALGATATLPELYAAAGATFAFDVGSLRTAVDLIEHTIDELEPQAARAS
jgi:oligoendopeptidase F